MGAPTAAPTGSIHQHILSLASNPYGDNPIFKDLKPNIGVSEDSLKATNPAAQKAILESSSQFKISPHSASKTLKVKPIGSAVSKKTLFDGLEEYDSSLEHSFSLKINAKRLIIKPKASPSVATGNSSFRDDSLAANANNNSLEKENEPINLNKESFNNEIPLHQSDNQVDNGRRVSWLQTNSLNRFRRTEPVSMDNTIKELMTKDKNDNPSVSAEKTPPPTISTRFQGNYLKRIVENFQATNYKCKITGGSLANESFLSPYGMDETQNEADLSLLDVEPHPTGIVLRRPGYYTIPNLDELNEYLDEEGTCVVPNFTIGRKGYGNVYFSESMDVAGMNLDEIVIFRHKEVILYPDEDNKPPVGTGLNRKAQVTLDQVWPHDKTLHQPIKDSVRLEAMDYESKLRRICDKHDTRFLEYRPDTGSCVFKVIISYLSPAVSKLYEIYFSG